MRICVVTDTLGDVNGVSRFIQNIAQTALDSARDLHVLTSTNFNVPDRPNIHNLPPRWARPMPRYENLELVFPRRDALASALDSLKPDVVHISTPGPVGHAGRRWALRRRVPIVGIYHTDFPAYLARLFNHRLAGRATALAMSRFYKPFARVITRSASYIEPVRALGIAPARITPLKPGIDTSRFSPAFRDPDIWSRCGAPHLARAGDHPAVNILSITRVSVEKNMPLLALAWARARPLFAARSIDARLIIVGDGPYRAQMEQTLLTRGANTPDVAFLGFRHGPDLSALYATGDLFAFPSTTDTLGQVVMEAQASGLPALVSNVGGPQEVIAPGVTGLALPATPADADTWARALAQLAADHAGRAAMSAAAAARLKPMTIAASFEHYWQLHEEALASSTDRRDRPSA